MTNNSSLEKYSVEGSKNRPKAVFNADTGKLVLEGRSILENTLLFFQPLLDWIDEYKENPAEKTEFHLVMDYFNTSASKFILTIFEKLEELYNSGEKVEIYWYFNDEDMEDLGEDYKHLIAMPFHIVDHTVA